MMREERRARWQAAIDGQAASGMSITAYCQANGIRPSLFHTWRRKLKEQQASGGGFVELVSERTNDTATGIRIHLGASLSISVARGFDPFTLRAVVETLGSYSRCLA